MGKNKKKFESKNDSLSILTNALVLMLVMFVFLVSLKLMGGTFKSFGNDAAEQIINATSNPFVSLFIGLLATAIIQSSSTSTSMVVAMVASGTLTIENAVPMIMGANIGTSVTSTFVSLGFIGSKKEYKKAISAATVHDFFNIMVVMIVFPLEYFFKFLSNLASGIAGFFSSTSSTDSEKMFSILDVTVKPTAKGITKGIEKLVYWCYEKFNGKISIGDAENINEYLSNWVIGLCLIFSLALLFFSLKQLTTLLKKLLIGKAEKKLDKLIFDRPVKALGWGTLLTMAVQSSSVTTSLIVPMVASNKVSLRKAFPFMMGANIGTTVTSLIAAMSTDATMLEAALTISLAHVLFNVLGATIVFPIKPLREIPVRLSRKLGKATMKNRLVGMAYIVITFFLIPFLLIMVSGGSRKEITSYKIKNYNIVENRTSYTVIEDNIEDKVIKRKVYQNLEKPEYSLSDEPTSELDVSGLANTIILGEDLYLLSDLGFCFDRSESAGKVQLCVDEIIQGYKLNEHIVKNCYIYQKTHYNPSLVDSTYEKLYLDIENLIIVKTEIFDKNDKVIAKSEIL